MIAAQLGLKVGLIYTMAKKLGLKKSKAFLNSDLSGRILRGKQHPTMISSRFKNGHQSWNKGIKGSTGLHKNSQATQFKVGRKPEESHNYKPIGSLRITSYGWLERKVSDDQSLAPARRWVALHRLVWEAKHGPIPKDHLITFKAGLKTTVETEVTIDRIECISKAENARRNSIWSNTPEMAKLYQLKGQITRQVNRIKKGQPK